MSRPARTVVKLAFLAVLMLLLATNLVNLWRNQQKHPVRKSPSSVYAASRESPSWAARTFEVYEYIRKNLAGKRLTVPAVLASHTWFFERLGRVTVDTQEHLYIYGRGFRALRRQDDMARHFYLRTDSRQLQIYFFLDPAADHYVVAENPEGRDLMVIPEAVYRREAARLAPAP